MSNLVSILGTKLINLMRISSAEDTDYLVIQKDTNGDQFTRIISLENFKLLIEGDGAPLIKQVFVSDGVINPTTQLVINTGDNTHTLPSTSAAILNVKSISGTVTLDPGVNTIENGNTITATVNRVFNLEAGVWLEL